jgi:cell division protein FtsB
MRFLNGVLFALLCLLQYRLWVGEGSQAEVYNLRQDMAVQQQELDRLRKRNQALMAEVQDLKEGLEAVEELARNEMGMIRDGEVFYQIVDAPPPPPVPNPAPPPGRPR